MEIRYPPLRFDTERDSFVVWLRWVSLESPPSPQFPPAQGIRVELQLNCNPVLGPTVVYRQQLEGQPIYLRANTQRTLQVLQTAALKGHVDVQLIIHGSIANAPFAALYVVRDYEGEAIDTAELPATPLLQLQPSTPGDRWHVAAQANLRLALELEGQRRHLTVLR